MDAVILVNQWDRKIGEMEKVAAHRGQAYLHRAISVFLFNEQGELLIQQRSSKKIVGALQWANTCCGNVRPQETYKQCAYRRLREELGIEEVRIQKVCKFQYQVRCNDEFSENEMDTVFVGRYTGVVKPNPDEVRSYAWVNPIQFKVDCQNNVGGCYAPWTRIMFEQEVVKIEEKIWRN